MSKAFTRLENFFRAYRQSYVIFTAFELGIFEILAHNSQDLNQLQRSTDCNLRGLDILLAALQSMDLVVKIEHKYTLNSEISSFFDPSSIQYCGDQIRHEHFLMKRWEKLPESIRDGIPMKEIGDVEAPDSVNRFISAMSNLGRRSAPLITEKIPFRDNENILDLGGGPGRYMEAILDGLPSVHVTLFDQSDTIRTARQILAQHPASERMNFISGDFFKDSFGNLYDTIFISNVVHIFGPEKVKILLKKCRKHLVTGGRVLIKDIFINEDGTGPLNTTLFALHMLLSTESGRCYRVSEIINMLGDTGFYFNHTFMLTEYSSVVEAKIR